LIYAGRLAGEQAEQIEKELEKKKLNSAVGPGLELTASQYISRIAPVGGAVNDLGGAG
jgi:hypothetical protein